MPQRDRRFIPDWAKQEHTKDLVLIREKKYIFWHVAQQGYKESGRGIVVMDTTSRLTENARAFAYLPQAGIENPNDQDALRMAQAYDPTREFLTMLFNLQAHVSTYRVGLPAQTRELAQDKRNPISRHHLLRDNRGFLFACLQYKPKPNH